eukprot:TRINITY_DN11345_c0_g1_i1.p1 TRINITY_DN11345_c0_g1~~TRINITY_DN11345_c0_g1_i1.p1  ORF type:complete len:399 (-),score=95.71 TRINITY_DN11345_c0_g1_i1:114-1310(-)
MIDAVLFSEFDNVVGPKVFVQDPSDFISPEEFDGVSDYIITKPVLCSRITCITTSNGNKILGVPTCIQNTKYQRNALMFNVSFVFRLNGPAKVYPYLSPDESENTALELSIYEPVLWKISEIFRRLEVNEEFLFKPDTKDKVKDIIAQIRADLNSLGQCRIPITDANTIYLRLIPKPSMRIPVRDWDVPVLVRNLRSFLNNDWDLTIQKILPLIDGVSYVRRIAQDADVDIELVKRGIQHLVYYKAIALIDIFQYSNMYTTTPTIHEFACNVSMQQDCIRCISVPGSGSLQRNTIFRLYCALMPGVTLREFCLEHAEDLRSINLRMFITYGVINRLIRRIHTYAIMMDRDQMRDSSDLPTDMFDGNHSFDEMCATHGTSKDKLEFQMLGNKSIVKFRK